MRHPQDNNFNTRLLKASEARQAMLRRAQRPAADDPMLLERKAARQAIVAAREARREAKVQAAAELAAKQAAEQAEQAALVERMAREEADMAVALLAEQKAQRDLRYAARKKRKA